MKTWIVAGLAGLLSTGAVMAEPIDPERIASATTGDWDKDGDTDLAMIVRPAQSSTEMNGIYIFLNDPSGGRMELKTVATNKVDGSFIYVGTDPVIEALPNGSILVTSQNNAVDQRHYTQKLTIAYRNFEFIVAGYTYAVRDAGPADDMECDLNVLTGKGELNGGPIKVAPQMVTIADWSDDIGLTACRP
ncbi:hypothetical protein [Pararhizobium sp.]|uniref:hypothetical protein n=1 Tax=Pararhizobium sp. TaxID=1977563 RepID=UPI002716D29D|nr:hypothetical protein [Pararhizobium sp.]MDO9415908.1 hypothetical protein [Pararhizobium sp.]